LIVEDDGFRLLAIVGIPFAEGFARTETHRESESERLARSVVLLRRDRESPRAALANIAVTEVGDRDLLDAGLAIKTNRYLSSARPRTSHCRTDRCVR
jgi:hypothetical protein